MSDILEEALRITKVDRNETYGPPDEDFSRTAAIWSALKGVKFEAREVALFMIAVKLSREVHCPKRDNAVDIAGYARCLDICNKAAEARSNPFSVPCDLSGVIEEDGKYISRETFTFTTPTIIPHS